MTTSALAVPLAQPITSSRHAFTPLWSADFSRPTMPSGLSFTRAGGAVTHATGTPWQTLGNHQPRLETVAGGVGLRVEGGRANILLQSANLGAAPWSSVSQSAVSGQPDMFGGTGGWLLTGTATNSRTQQTVSVTPGTTYTFWGVVREGSSANANLRMDVDGQHITLFLNFGMRTFTDASTAPYQRSYFEDLGAGNFLVGFTFTPQSSTSVTPQFKAGTGTLGVLLAQMEIGSRPSSYIATTSAAVTRAPDLLVAPQPQAVGLGIGQGTILMELVPGQRENQAVVWQLGSNLTCLRITTESSGQLAANVRTGGSDQILASANNVVQVGQLLRVAVSYRAQELRMLHSGGTMLQRSITLPAGLEALYLGNRAGADRALFGHLRRMVCLPEQRPDAYLTTFIQTGAF